MPEMRFYLSVILISAVLSGCSSLTKSHESSHDASSAIRVATYNIKHGRGMDGTLDLERTATTLESLGADIIALQEVDDQARRSGGIDQAEAVEFMDDMHRFMSDRVRSHIPEMV